MSQDTSTPTTAPDKQFHVDAERMTHDLHHRDFINHALSGYYKTRDAARGTYQNYQQARAAAAETKWQAVNHLDEYLTEFTEKLEARGTKVFWAENGDSARDYILSILEKHSAHHVIKSKTMTSEEIHLNAALEKDGYEVLESDLGEYIVQLNDEAPYHLVFPAMHLTREEIGALFTEKLGVERTDSPEELTMVARDVMRFKYLEADVGISGGNFAVAETGMIAITENEGNARLTTALPKVHIALVGIEKVLPKMSDLALFWPLLSSSGAGQALTCYSSLIGGPKQEDESDGPDEFHVVLLDNGRTDLLADPEQRDILHCIRCGACLNVCPIFKNVGGHTYNTTYQGPIGSVLTPHLRGLQDWKHLSFASSLCGACTETCPVKIDLHHHLLHNRRNSVEEKSPPQEKTIWKGFAFLMNNPSLYRLALRLGRIGQKFHPLIKGTRLDPARGWTQTREAPPLAPQSFGEYWRTRARTKKSGGQSR